MESANPTMRLPSNAPNACPPILVATTNNRRGSSSTSLNPQISCCSRTASLNSACVVSARVSIIGSLGLLPECLHLFDVCAGELGTRLDVREPPAELRIRFAQILFGVYLHEARQVYQHEQQIANLALQLLARSTGARLIQFVQLFVQLIENLLGILPVEPDPRCLRRDLLRLNQCRQIARDRFQQSAHSFALALFLIG